MASSYSPVDLDMAKLQKSSKQRERHSSQLPHQIAKLTPSEIRSLNNSVNTNRDSSLSTSQASSPIRHHRLSGTSPPTTPDSPTPYQTQQATALHEPSRSSSQQSYNTTRQSVVSTQQSRSSSQQSRHSTSLPTPPQSPDGQPRRAHRTSHAHYGHHHVHHVHHQQYRGQIHHPSPRSSVHADFLINNRPSSRPSSQNSFRSPPTYRGSDMTRTGSRNMLQNPSNDIVANPLSQFSRPRQSVVSPSPDSLRQNSLERSGFRSNSMSYLRSQSEPSVGDRVPLSDRESSPPVRTDSPVSMENAAEPESVPTAGDTALTKQVSDEPGPLKTETMTKSDPTVIEQNVTSTKNHRSKRSSLGSIFLDKTEKLHLFKPRRRTLSFTKGQDVVGPSTDAKIAEPSNTTENQVESKKDFTQHPAVRPLSVVIPDNKGKHRDSHSAPVYTRCACCGKLKKPSGYATDLSPVMENENLRTNFSFELERTSIDRPRSSLERSRHIPIIPMAVSQTEAIQSRIEPATFGDTRSSVSSKDPMTRVRRTSDTPKIVRFASLHGKQENDEALHEQTVNEEGEDYIARSFPVQDNITVVRPDASVPPEASNLPKPQDVNAGEKSDFSAPPQSFDEMKPRNDPIFETNENGPIIDETNEIRHPDPKQDTALQAQKDGQEDQKARKEESPRKQKRLTKQMKVNGKVTSKQNKRDSGFSEQIQPHPTSIDSTDNDQVVISSQPQDLQSTNTNTMSNDEQHPNPQTTIKDTTIQPSTQENTNPQSTNRQSMSQTTPATPTAKWHYYPQPNKRNSNRQSTLFQSTIQHIINPQSKSPIPDEQSNVYPAEHRKSPTENDNNSDHNSDHNDTDMISSTKHESLDLILPSLQLGPNFTQTNGSLDEFIFPNGRSIPSLMNYQTTSH